MSKTASAVVLIGAGVVLIAIVRQSWDYAHRDVDYAGMQALSAPWSAPPSDEEEPWHASPSVPPPPENATRADLIAWLRKHYPGLTIGMFDESTVKPDREIDLGGWPPRRLYVEPGKGLVMRDP